ncbi:MAG TPA: FecR family protein [Terriglobia bacterium]|nr:FecR family protein [Terriglobia bacterium]
MSCRPFLLIAVVLGFTLPVFPKTGTPQGQSERLSHVRVVRLSFVQGTVTVRGAGTTQWAKGLVNSPIQEGFSLATAPKSFAEVEFENGSTIRLGELSRIDFTELALTPQGDKINHLAFDQGYATFHFLPEHNDDYQVKTADATLTPHGKSEFRTDFEQGKLRVEVFSGHVDVAAPHAAERIGKDKVLAYNTASGKPFDLTHGIQKDQWDQWAMARDQQTTLAFNDQAVSPESQMYGWSDLGTYGDWSYYPGYGYGWAPYEGMGWSPYSMGMMGVYPGMGYTWISGEPWGWLPYHYGLWNFDSGMGWFWSPGLMGGGWSPALVNWYGGGGLIGWGPMGMGCALSGPGCIMTAPYGALQNGGLIASGGGAGPAPGEVKRINEPQAPLAALTRSPGLPLPRGVVFPGGPRGALIASGGGRVPASAFLARSGLAHSTAQSGIQAARGASARAPRSITASSFARGGAAAPSTVIMGKQVSPQAVLGSHQSFFDRAFVGSNRGPVHAALGNTLGGRFPTVADAHGNLMPKPVEGRGMESARGFSAMGGRTGGSSFSRMGGGPVALPRMSAQGGGRSSGRSGFSGGSFGGGHGGGFGFSRPSASAPSASAGHAAAGGGGGSHH